MVNQIFPDSSDSWQEVSRPEHQRVTPTEHYRKVELNKDKHPSKDGRERSGVDKEGKTPFDL